MLKPKGRKHKKAKDSKRDELVFLLDIFFGRAALAGRLGCGVVGIWEVYFLTFE